MKKTINVVGAIIENEKHEILCALRSTTMSLPNLWEFPGGKVEGEESYALALQREIKEELLCNIEVFDVFDDSSYEYEKVIVRLKTLKCRLLAGEPTPTEHSALIWLKRESLQSLHWAPADVPAVDKLVNEVYAPEVNS